MVSPSEMETTLPVMVETGCYGNEREISNEKMADYNVNHLNS